MAQLRLEISSDFDEFEKFNLSSPQSNPFQSIGWLKAFSEIFDISLEILFAKKGDEIVAGLILPVKKKLIFPASTPLLFTYYSGILFKDFSREKRQKQIIEKNEAIEKIHRYLESKLKLFIFKLHYTIDDVRQFKWLGYKIKPRHTFILNIESLERAWDGLSNSLKRKIKEAQERDFKVIKTTDVEKLSEQQILSYEKSGGKFFLGFKDLKKLLEKLVQNGTIQVYHVVDKNNTVLASRGISIWKDKGYDIIAGMRDREVDVASHFLLWKILEDLSSNGVREFDFCGADIQSVSFFKTQFGGEIKISFEVGYANGIFKILIR